MNTHRGKSALRNTVVMPFVARATIRSQLVRTFYTSSSPRPTGAGPDNGRTANSPAPAGLRASGAGLYLWAAGYVPVVAGLWTIACHPRWPWIVSAAPNGVNPAARPILPRW